MNWMQKKRGTRKCTKRTEMISGGEDIMITLPSREGWDVEITCNNGKKIFKVLLKRDYRTKEDVETFINYTYGITREDCVKYEINQAIV